VRSLSYTTMHAVAACATTSIGTEATISAVRRWPVYLCSHFPYGAELKSVRETLHLSQAVMVRRLRTNDRTYQNWEQGKSKPNAQAALLIKLVEKHPETLERLAAL